MNISEVFKKQLLKKKCPLHPTYHCDMILFSQITSKNRRICIKCCQQNKYSLNELIPIRDLINATNKTILEAFPPLNNDDIHEYLKLEGLEELQEEINTFFDKLTLDFTTSIEKLRKQQTQQLTRRRDMQLKVLEAYEQIAMIEDLKQAVFSNEQEDDKLLEDFIQFLWENKDANSQKIETAVNHFKNTCSPISFSEPKKIAQKALATIESISFFQITNDLLPQTEFIKSTYQASQQLSLTRNRLNQHLTVENIFNDCVNGQAYLDFILQPNEKYIINLQLEQLHNQNRQFAFGIASDAQKDVMWMSSEKISYFEEIGNKGINKLVKGPPIITGDNSMRKRQLEVRIHLAEKYLRVGSLPFYESVVEVDNPERIDLSVPYRFFVRIFHPKNKVTITKLFTVEQFDNKFS